MAVCLQAATDCHLAKNFIHGARPLVPVQSSSHMLLMHAQTRSPNEPGIMSGIKGQKEDLANRKDLAGFAVSPTFQESFLPKMSP